MPRYKCKNKECVDFDIEMSCNSITKIVNGQLVDSAESCPKCKSKRLLIVEDGMTTTMSGSPNICKK